MVDVNDSLCAKQGHFSFLNNYVIMFWYMKTFQKETIMYQLIQKPMCFLGSRPLQPFKPIYCNTLYLLRRPFR